MTTDEICDALKNTLRKKNADYGNAASESPVLVPTLPAETAILVRMSDKIQRIRNLLTTGSVHVNESIQDSVMDLAGYCILFIEQQSRKQ